MQQKWKILRSGQRVVDLGCAPGSWSRYAHEQIGFGGVLVGIDIQEVAGYPGHFLQQSIEETELEQMRGLLGGDADVVISDMAPSTTGNASLSELISWWCFRAGLLTRSPVMLQSYNARMAKPPRVDSARESYRAESGPSW